MAHNEPGNVVSNRDCGTHDDHSEIGKVLSLVSDIG
eukprot:CAMPEP_0176348334 /NCGR_PEP_ID=MMETSP0126-20121128/7777_1 /TAXON_ID=141414 ORGANISM="Strombidinopsis acuminatum, Strain SPMC142" /NCGR_SAMPLE_ID=MMETSP0126 /ASSEMBLY_ACC=CAM_ASM_000229 /LENGTH=35 /DNA_ID= /DNA_START= /DNA_END= /DNA_ORIENTATION=